VSASASSWLPPDQLAERTLARLGQPGVVVVHEHHGVEVRFAANTVTTNGTRRLRRVTVVAVRPTPTGAAVGVASGSGDAETLVDSARASAASAGDAPDASDLVAGDAAPDFADPPGESPPEVLDGVLGDLPEVLARAAADGLVASGFAEHQTDTVHLASSTGLRLRHAQPTGRLQLVERTADGSASTWAGIGAERFEAGALVALDTEARRRLAWSARRVALPAGRYPTVLPADAVADLMCMVGEAASGREADEGRSVFARPSGGTRIGERISRWPVDLTSDPADERLACLPFVVATASTADASVFDNGLGLARTPWIADGTVARLRRHRAGARQAGVDPAPPIDNLTLSVRGATGDVDDLVAGVDRGLLVTCLWYIREVDPTSLLLTGLTRDGVYLIEHGEVTAAVNNFRWNERPVDLLDRASAFGATRRALSREWNEWSPRTAMAPMVVPDFTMSSVSPAT
jgi:predicted Zn-dependent protease